MALQSKTTGSDWGGGGNQQGYLTLSLPLSLTIYNRPFLVSCILVREAANMSSDDSLSGLFILSDAEMVELLEQNANDGMSPRFTDDLSG